MGLFVLLLIYGIPAVLALVGIAFLIRAAIASKTGAPSMGRKAETLFSHATVVDKVHYYTTAQKGFFHFYYITFLLDENDRLSLKVSKRLHKKVDINDKVKLYYKGEKLVNLEIVEKSGIKSKAREVHVTNFNQIP